MEGLRTLIVDDSSVMRKIVERALRQAGLAIGEVLEAGNGFEALDILRQQKVDLVLSDINMPVMDGLEFVRQIAHRGQCARRAGADDHHRRQRVARDGSDLLRSARLHPQALHSRSDETPGAALAGQQGCGAAV